MNGGASELEAAGSCPPPYTASLMNGNHGNMTTNTRLMNGNHGNMTTNTRPANGNHGNMTTNTRHSNGAVQVNGDSAGRVEQIYDIPSGRYGWALRRKSCEATCSVLH